MTPLVSCSRASSCIFFTIPLADPAHQPGIIICCAPLQTLRINRALQTLFFSLAVLFFLLAGGVRNALCNKVAGWVGMWVALVAFYCATAILTGEVWEHVSPHSPFPLLLPEFFSGSHHPRVHLSDSIHRF